MTPSGIEPATFRLLAKCINQLCHQQRAPLHQCTAFKAAPTKKFCLNLLREDLIIIIIIIIIIVIIIIVVVIVIVT
jgi:hypothetical protein